MQIWTISDGARLGAEVETFTLKNGEISIPAIIIGEDGRGRELGVLPVHLHPDNLEKWKKDGRLFVKYATLGKTKSGKPKLFEVCMETPGSVGFIAIMRTEIGFRGSNEHTGELIEEKKDDWGSDCSIYENWPGENICSGYIAEGAAGRAGGGHQYVAVMPKGVVFRTKKRGRLYGKPGEFFYKHDGSEVLFCTAEEREVSELF